MVVWSIAFDIRDTKRYVKFWVLIYEGVKSEFNSSPIRVSWHTVRHRVVDVVCSWDIIVVVVFVVPGGGLRVVIGAVAKKKFVCVCVSESQPNQTKPNPRKTNIYSVEETHSYGVGVVGSTSRSTRRSTIQSLVSRISSYLCGTYVSSGPLYQKL